MTPEEAREILSKINISVGLGESFNLSENQILEATSMAIKALEQQPCEDCISREAVRTILANQRDELIKLHTVNPKDNPKADAMAYGVNWSLNTLMELPSVTPKSEWIPVSERLPEEYCLFCDIDGDVYYGHIYDKKWWADGQDDRIKKVVAWMPLPEPYAESENK